MPIRVKSARSEVPVFDAPTKPNPAAVLDDVEQLEREISEAISSLPHDAESAKRAHLQSLLEQARDAKCNFVCEIESACSPTQSDTPAEDSARNAPAGETVTLLLRKLDDLTGLSPVKREVRSLVNYLRVQRLRVDQGLPTGQLTIHLVFTGNRARAKRLSRDCSQTFTERWVFLPRGN